MSKNLLFSSSGDNTNFLNFWCSDGQNYDIFIIYYGDDINLFEKYSKSVKFIERRKGAKFQNFHYFYHKYPEIIAKYERFFILDDDIEITTKDINRMFEISEQFNLSICGPSFSGNSKIPPAFKRLENQRPGVLLEYTNFIEVNSPLYSKVAIENTMKNFDPVLIGWGIDLLSIWSNDHTKQDAFAIIHEVSCTNPHNNNKKIKRHELMLIPKADERAKIWYHYAKKINCPIFDISTYNIIIYSTVTIKK